MPIADYYAYLGVAISKDCSWDAHIILTDSHLDVRVKDVFCLM